MKSRSVCALGALVPLLSVGVASADAPPDYDAYQAAAALGAAVHVRQAAPARVASVDDKRGAPRFLWGAGATLPVASSLSPEEAARGYLVAQAGRYGASSSALSTLVLRRIHDTGRGAIVVVFGHEIAGAPLFHHDVKVALRRDHSLVAITGSLEPLATPTLTPTFATTEADALATALADRFAVAVSPSDLLITRKRTAGYLWFDASRVSSLRAAGLATLPARARPVWYTLPDRLVPAFYVELGATDVAAHVESAFAYVVSALDGSVLHRQNLVHYDTFQYRVWADAADPIHRPADGPTVDYTPYPGAAPNGSVPAFVPPSLISMEGFNTNPSGAADPWLPAGATQTQGNNVDAYVDVYTDNNEPGDGFAAGDTRATTTSAGVFDRTFDTSGDPQASAAQKMAAVTQLFYTTNWLHDWWYDSGFTETSMNAQASNYGRGGVEGDAMNAEAQAGAGTQYDNSNMSAFTDGMSPRMHMYLWHGKANDELQVSTSSYTTGDAVYGPQTFSVSAQLDDESTNDGCASVSAGAVGKVALLVRGNCTFETKTLNAQSGGAVGVIIMDNKSATAPVTPGSDPTITTAITIPTYGVTQADGTAIAAMGGSLVTMARSVATDRDADLDNSIIAHEWGHYLHLRHVDCETNQCLSESEGWGDFNALMTILRPGDDLTGTYALATYSTSAFPDDPAYFGIRRYPYSTDMTKSPLTFKYITNDVALPTGVPVATSTAQYPNSEVHAAGEIWAAMLFEGFTSLLSQSQGASPRYTFEEARRRMGDYVVGGLTMAPPDPSYTEQRDAILAAALAADPADAALLAQGFAKRGAGTCAVSPSKSDATNAGVVEDFTISANLNVTQVTVDDSTMSCDHDGILDFGEKGLLTATVFNSGFTTVTGAQATVATSATDASFPSGTVLSFGDIPSGMSATASIPVALTGSPPVAHRVSFTVTPTGGCNSAGETLLALVDADQEAKASDIDDVEATTTTWIATGTDADKIWSRVIGYSGSQLWQGIDFGAPSDTALVSPPLSVSASDPLTMQFTHTYTFESGKDRAGDPAYYDGAVIEVTDDTGATWTDISTYGDASYAGTIGDPDNQATNPLKGRAGYVGVNPSNPASDTVLIDLGTMLAGKTIQVRFRVATDDAGAAPGWQIDDIGFTGITNEPFTKVVDDSCLETPVADAGPDQTVDSGDTVTLDGSHSSDPQGIPLAFAWTETLGPTLSLVGGDAAKPTFVAPDVSAITKFTFQLAVSAEAAMASDSVNVFVRPTGTSSSSSSVSSSASSGSGGATSSTVGSSTHASSGAGMNSGAGGSGGGVGAGDSSASSGCGCETADPSENPSLAASAVALAALLVARRRRRAR